MHRKIVPEKCFSCGVSVLTGAWSLGGGCAGAGFWGAAGAASKMSIPLGRETLLPTQVSGSPPTDGLSRTAGLFDDRRN